MATAPLDEDSYPEPLMSAGRSGGSFWRVGALAAFFIIVALGISLLSSRIPPDLMLMFLATLAVIGVFCLFGLAAGLFRFGAAEEGRTLSRAIVDSLPQG